MTISTSNTRELNIGQLVGRAIQLAGLMPAGAAQSGVQWNNLAVLGKDFLDVTVKAMQGDGYMPRNIELYPITMIAGQASYVMPDGTLEVDGDASYLQEGTTDGSTIARIMERETYLRLSSKLSQGVPTLYYPDMSVPLTLTLWPIPADNGTLTVQRERIIADSNDGTKTVELQSYWEKFLMYETAHMLAVSQSQPLQTCGYLRARASDELEDAKNRAAQKAPSQIVVTHRTGW